ncbi:MAG: putative membrane protein [Planctomycetota bacterium]|jgi:uncharacterized membrane protein
MNIQRKWAYVLVTFFAITVGCFGYTVARAQESPDMVEEFTQSSFEQDVLISDLISVDAAEVAPRQVFRMRVQQVVSRGELQEEWTGQMYVSQVVTAKFLNGEQKGEVIEVTDDYLELEKGESFFMQVYYDAYQDVAHYTAHDYDRTGVLLWLVILLMVIVVGFAGRQGLRAIGGLLGSFLVVIYILIPGILGGVSPLLLSVLAGSVILIFAIVVTHGWNRTSGVALLGTSITLVVTALLAVIAVQLAQVTGFTSQDVVSLQYTVDQFIDLRGLLLGGIIIGVLGVLDDIAITQVSVVRQLWKANQALSKKSVFRSALTVGRDHMSSLVNTLVLAYMGVGLPLLLLFRSMNVGFLEIVNYESVAIEIIRMVVGSIGLIMCVPITTLLAVYFYGKHKEYTHGEEGHICGAHGCHGQ